MKRHLKQICLMALVCLEAVFLSCSGKKAEIKSGHGVFDEE